MNSILEPLVEEEYTHMAVSPSSWLNNSESDSILVNLLLFNFLQNKQYPFLLFHLKKVKLYGTHVKIPISSNNFFKKTTGKITCLYNICLRKKNFSKITPLHFVFGMLLTKVNRDQTGKVFNIYTFDKWKCETNQQSVTLTQAKYSLKWKECFAHNLQWGSICRNVTRCCRQPSSRTVHFSSHTYTRVRAGHVYHTVPSILCS